MGDQSISDRSNGQVIDEAWFDVLRQVLSGDLYPRASSGAAPTNETANLGSAAYRWKRANVRSGEFTVGSIKFRHSYNGLVVPSEGWMLCDGRTVTEANYNTEHGAGHWASYIGSSPIQGKYLPNMTSRYLVGAASVSQDGTSALTPVGNGGSTVNLSHNHKWYTSLATNATDTTFNTSGSAVNLATSGSKNDGKYSAGVFISSHYPGADQYTDKQLGTAVDIRPTSIEVMYYMRVI